MTTLRQAALDVLASYDRIEEMKTDFQTLEQRLILFAPYIEVYKKRVEILREALELDAVETP